MQTITTEVAPDIFRFSTYVGDFNLQFNQFLVRDDEPLLYHTGMNALFPLVRDAVAAVIDPSTIRWISFSHFEADECGSLNQWLELAPNAQAMCGFVGAAINVNDFASREARILEAGEVVNTGKHGFRYVSTPHLPHCWEAGHLFEETTRSLFCSDLFHQVGDVEPVTTSDIVGRFRAALVEYQASPLANYMPYTPQTATHIKSLAALAPTTLLPMHGSTYNGDGKKAIEDMGLAIKDVLS